MTFVFHSEIQNPKLLWFHSREQRTPKGVEDFLRRVEPTQPGAVFIQEGGLDLAGESVEIGKENRPRGLCIRLRLPLIQKETT